MHKLLISLAFTSVHELVCHAEMDREAELTKASKPRAGKVRQTKLDKDGNRPDISVYAKAYNKVKAQFTRMRYGYRRCGWCF